MSQPKPNNYKVIKLPPMKKPHRPLYFRHGPIKLGDMPRWTSDLNAAMVLVEESQIGILMKMLVTWQPSLKGKVRVVSVGLKELEDDDSPA